MVWLIAMFALNGAAVAYFATRCTKVDLKIGALREDFDTFKGGFDAAVWSRMASVTEELKDEQED